MLQVGAPNPESRIPHPDIPAGCEAGPRARRCATVRLMFDPKFIDDLSHRLHASLPEGVRALQQDVDRNLRAAVQAALGKLDVVTREEFDVQAKVLARTRAQLDAMTRRVAELEARVLGTAPTAGDDQDMDGG